MRHCEARSDEAIQLGGKIDDTPGFCLDCFASLAMTVSPYMTFSP